VIVRHPEKLEKRESLTAKAGDVYDTASLAALIRGNEAIISAFNPGWKNPNLYDDQVRETVSIGAAIKKEGIKRVLWVGGAGGLEVKPGVRVIDSPDMPLWVHCPPSLDHQRVWGLTPAIAHDSGFAFHSSPDSKPCFAIPLYRHCATVKRKLVNAFR
jgi:hypothetical protein